VKTAVPNQQSSEWQLVSHRNAPYSLYLVKFTTSAATTLSSLNSLLPIMPSLMDQLSIAAELPSFMFGVVSFCSGGS